MDTVFCRTTNKGEQSFYLLVDRAEYYLFTQGYRRSNKKYFERGISLEDLYKFSRTNSTSARMTLEKLQKFIPYIEKEYGLVLRNQTRRKASRGNKSFRQRKQEMYYLTEEYV